MAGAPSRAVFQRYFVGNLPWTVGHRDLREYFREFGRIASANVIFDKKTGLSRGFGFVLFETTENIAQNLENKSKLVFEGQTLTVQKTS